MQNACLMYIYIQHVVILDLQASFRKKILQLRLTWAQRYFQLFCADLWLKPHLLIRGHSYWPVNTHLDWRLPSYNAGNQAPIKWEKHLPGPFVQSEREWPTHLQPNPCYSQAQKPQCTFYYKQKTCPCTSNSPPHDTGPRNSYHVHCGKWHHQAEISR